MRQQHVEQRCSAELFTADSMRMYQFTHARLFSVSMESVDSSCVEINECSFAYFIHIKRSSVHMATFRPSTPTFQILTRDLVTQIVIFKYFMYLGTH